MTPLDCALQRGFRSTAKFLQLHGGVPASRLGSLRQSQVQVSSSAVSLQIRDDVTLFGESSSESEKDVIDGAEKQKKKSHKRKISYKHERKREVPITESEFESTKLAQSGRLDPANRTIKKPGGKVEPGKSDTGARGYNIDSSKGGEYGAEQERFNYTTKVKVTENGEIVNIQRLKNEENIQTTDSFDKVKDQKSQPGKGKPDQRPRSAKHSRLQERQQQNVAKHKPKADTPDPRRKDILEDNNNNRKLLVELKREDSLNVRTKSTQYEIELEESVISTSEMVRNKVQAVEKTQGAAQADQQSVISGTSHEEGGSNILVEAAVHAPPRSEQVIH